MTAAAIQAVEAPAEAVGGADRARILTYCGGLVLLVTLGAPYNGLIDVPVVFFLKNKLHLTAHELAGFRLFSAIPLYLSFLFGFTRDRWNRRGLSDRRIMVLFGAATAIIYTAFAFAPISYATLLGGLVVVTCSFLFVLGAQNGLLATVAQRRVMSGQISTVWNIFLSVPVLIAFFIGGFLSDQLEGRNANEAARILFLIGGAVMGVIILYALAKPRSVFEDLEVKAAPPARPLQDLARLVRHWPIYPALLIWLLFNFAPGAQTVLQYYLSNTLHANDAEWGAYNAIFAASFIPTFLLFGFLCRKVPLRRLLWWGTVITVPQMVPLIFVHSAAGALVAAVPIGLMGGVATAAYWDLLIRSCPPGLQGAVLMMSVGLYYISGRFGDLWGTNLYQHPGRLAAYVSNWGAADPQFTLCALATTVVYALMLPTLLLVPRRLIAAPDGETIPETGAAG